MERPKAVLRTIGGDPVLRFERRFAHPPEKVWRAVSDPAELAHWFPAEVRTEPRAGAPVRFAFPDEAPVPADGGRGEVLEYDPPRVHAFTWNQDVLRFELFPDGEGCLLVFTHTIGGGAPGRLTAGRDAHGWDVCLAALEDRLSGAEFTPPGGMLQAVEAYVARFGLDQGEVLPGEDGRSTVHFARDLGWTPVEKVWEILTGGEAPSPAPSRRPGSPTPTCRRGRSPRLRPRTCWSTPGCTGSPGRNGPLGAAAHPGCGHPGGAVAHRPGRPRGDAAHRAGRLADPPGDPVRRGPRRGALPLARGAHRRAGADVRRPARLNRARDRTGAAFAGRRSRRRRRSGSRRVCGAAARSARSLLHPGAGPRSPVRAAAPPVVDAPAASVLSR
ncbi:SRPBCC domain-containing protein [Nocardiopsis composta]